MILAPMNLLEFPMSTQKQSAHCTNSTNSSISEIREISGPAPKISVIVPVYKVEKYLPECIESVLAQTFTDFELILVDDGSPDNSGAICDAYAARDPRIRVFHKENGGVSSARNLGVRNARADHVAFLDSDDWWKSEYLEKMFKLITCFPAIGIYGNAWTHDWKKLKQPIKERLNVFDVFEYLKASPKKLFSFPFYTSSIIIEKKLLHSSIFNESLIVGEDYDVWLNILMKTNGLVAFIPAPLVLYRIVREEEKPRGGLPAIEKHFISKCDEIFQHMRTKGLGWWCDRYLASNLSFYLGSESNAYTIKSIKEKINFSNVSVPYRILFSIPAFMSPKIKAMYASVLSLKKRVSDFFANPHNEYKK